jgi:hypothetical protein
MEYETPNIVAMPVLHYNRTIRLLLKDLAELKSESDPVELCCLWFDDFYFPGQLRPPGYPVSVWERGQRGWKDCFSVHELQVLAEFHAVFFAEADKLPTTAKWQQDPGWQRVSQAANIALRDI